MWTQRIVGVGLIVFGVVLAFERKILGLSESFNYWNDLAGFFKTVYRSAQILGIISIAIGIYAILTKKDLTKWG